MMGRPVVASMSVLLILVICCHTSLSLEHPPRNVDAVVDGDWSCWITFGDCSKTCGKGDLVRYRVCDRPRPSNGGKNCVGLPIQRKTCNSHACPVDGGWGEWISITECSKSCGKGEKISYRRCDNPWPNAGGKKCSGESVQRIACNVEPCPAIMKDCTDYYNDGQRTDGVYTIQPDGKTTVKVYCDMTGGGWTVIHKRYDGSTRFYDKKWTDYKRGFGNPQKEYWLGLENIHLLTKNVRILKIEMKKFNSNTNYVADYSTFWVGPESSGYILLVDGYSGNAGNSLGSNSGYRFTTIDKDNDTSTANCARLFEGAWWHWHCANCSLNGRYRTSRMKVRGSGGGSTTMHWIGVDGRFSLQQATMKLR